MKGGAVAMDSVNQISSSGAEPLLVPAAEVARMLQVSARTLWRLRSAGQLPALVRLGGAVRWRLEEIRKWIAEGCRTPVGGDNERRRV